MQFICNQLTLDTIRGREQLFGGGDQLPIPTHYKMSVWGGTSPPHTLNSWPGGTSAPPLSPPHAHVWLTLLSKIQMTKCTLQFEPYKQYLKLTLRNLTPVLSNDNLI